MHTRTLLNAGVFVLLLVLTIEVAGMSRSLRRIEHEERRLVTHCVAEGRGSVLYLLSAPMLMPTRRAAPPNIYTGPVVMEPDITAPLSRWTKTMVFSTEEECNVGIEQRALVGPRWEYQCLSADDPRLKPSP